MTDVFEMVFPGLMLMWVCFIASGVFSDIFVEYKSNTFARMISGGVDLRQILLSKVLRCLVICWVCELLLILFTGGVFGMDWWKHPVMLAVVLTAFNIFLLGLLALVYGYARTSDSANAILMFVFMLSSVVGGSFTPYENLPRTLQRLGRWSMIRIGNYGIESLFQSRPLWESLRPSLLLTGAGLLLMGLGMRVLSQRIRKGKIA
jgi:ABC-2 type transport system permease protein